MADFVSGLKIGAKLGNGHFGEVFKGQDPAHGEVAVKILRREAYHDDASWPDYKAAYLAEAQNLSKAMHRNVVQVYHVVEAPDGESVVICMAFCPGGSLQTPFEIGPMALPAVRRLGTEVLMGFGTMHARGMIHRDIKPANTGRIQTGPFGSQLHAHEYQPNGIPIVNPTHLAGNRINHEDVPRISEERAKSLSRHLLQLGDLLFARRGEIGRLGLVGPSEVGWVCGTGCFVVRVRNEEIHNPFLARLFSTDGAVAWLESNAAGAIMPNLNHVVLAKLPLAIA